MYNSFLVIERVGCTQTHLHITIRGKWAQYFLIFIIVWCKEHWNSETDKKKSISWSLPEVFI